MSTRISDVFTQDTKGLSTEFQAILADDLVTAFESRINVLIRAQTKKSY